MPRPMKCALLSTACFILVSRAALAQPAPAAPTETAPAPPTAAAPPANAGSSAAPPGFVSSSPASGPASYGPEQPHTKRHSTGMMIAGIIMTAVGAADAIAGVIEFTAAEDICGAVSASSTEQTCVDTYKVVGVTGMVLGGVLVAVGLPLAIIGGSKETVRYGATPSSLARGVEPAGALSLRVGPGSTALRIAF